MATIFLAFMVALLALSSYCMADRLSAIEKKIEKLHRGKGNE